MYDIFHHQKLALDPVRTNAYLEGLKRAVKAGSVVVDLGTGMGIWALVACQLGARKVYAIEFSQISQLARQLAAENGLAERIEVIQALSTQVQIPEKADVIVYEIHGQQPMVGGSLRSIIDARDRFLAPGGTMLPSVERLWAAVVHAPEAIAKYVGGWQGDDNGFTMKSAVPFAADWMYKHPLPPEALLTGPLMYFTLDYHTLSSPDVVAELSFTAKREGMGHGLQLWFDSDFGGGVKFSTGPGEPEIIFGRTFIPWRTPVVLAAGDRIVIALAFHLMTDFYVWKIDTRIMSAESGAIKAEFHQSSLKHQAPMFPSTAR
ncbi:MAG TPA: 50S ribosomal protein L11 methyltransferase [Terriglobales bacterium]|nr:50S ribosomal protein L11 methyltransferase [Terriglobales bacterium]